MSMGNLIEKSVSGLGIRLSLVGLLPTTVLVLFIFALVWGGAPAKAPNFDAVVAEIGRYDAAQGLLLILAILVLTLVLQPFQFLLVRLLEGYWGNSKLSRNFSAFFVKRHRKELNDLLNEQNTLLNPTESSSPPSAETVDKAGRLADRIKRFYPENRPLLPTTLGNVLRAGEERAGAPYDLDVITVWPRLYAILPERTAAIVDDEQNQLDIAVRFCITFGVATVVSAGLLFQHGWWLAVPLATFVLAWISYRGAVASALAYGLGIRTAVDLHRFELLRALHLPLPPHPEAERQTNALLSLFLRQNVPMDVQLRTLGADFHYDHPSET